MQNVILQKMANVIFGVCHKPNIGRRTSADRLPDCSEYDIPPLTLEGPGGGWNPAPLTQDFIF